MMHAAMHVLPAQLMAETGEIVFVRKFLVHAAGVFLAQKSYDNIQH
jgi:hypothetical protein